MKSILSLVFTISTFLYFEQGFSQPVLNCSVEYGDIAITGSYDSIFEGNSGENIIWDFSDLEVNPFNFYGVLEPSATPYASNFPNANYVNYDYNNYYEYYQCDELVHSGLGHMFPDEDYSLSDHRDMLRFPMTYLDAFVDSFASVQQWGTDSVFADGYGTLIMPFGTFENVLRVRDIANFSESWTTASYRSVHYRFFSESFFFPIFQV